MYTYIHQSTQNFFVEFGNFIFDGFFYSLKASCLLTAICSVKTLVGLFGNKGRPKLIKLLRFNFFSEIGEGGLKRTL